LCFSPEASFGSSLILAGFGVATLRKALRFDRSMLIVATFPLIFAAHQFLEGMVWITVDAPQQGAIFRYLYLIIAFLFWPTLMPLGVLVPEPNSFRRKICTAFLACGIGLTLSLAYQLFASKGIDVSVVGHSLCYRPVIEDPPLYLEFLYPAILVVPGLVSSNKALKLYAALAFVAWAITYFFQHEVYFSTWCMAGALLSVTILFSIKGSRSPADELRPQLA
jgi:hypothetical protein